MPILVIAPTECQEIHEVEKLKQAGIAAEELVVKRISSEKDLLQVLAEAGFKASSISGLDGYPERWVSELKAKFL